MRLILLIFIFYSCASSEKINTISDDKNDALRMESLYRFNETRLSKLDLTKPLNLCHQGQFNEAKKIFKYKLESVKNNSNYWKDMATCYFLSNEYPKALFYNNLALNLTSDNSLKSAIINNIGLIFLRMKKYDEAISYFNHAIKLNPKALTPKYNLAQVFLYFNHFEKAGKILSNLHQLHPYDIDFIYLNAQLYLMQNDIKKASDFFSKIPEKYHTQQIIANNLALLYFYKKEYSKAHSILRSGDRKGSIDILSAFSDLDKLLSKYISRGEL